MAATLALDDLARDLARGFRDGDTALFVGAGISRRSGLPLAMEVVDWMCGRIGLSAVEVDAIRQARRPFEAFMEDVAVAARGLDDFAPVFDCGAPNTNHRLVARLARERMVTALVTTNFDLLVERALDAEGLRRGADYHVYARDDELPAVATRAGFRLAKVHGSVDSPSQMAINLWQVAATLLTRNRREVMAWLFSAASHRRVLVLGYSCSDLFDLTPQIRSLDGPRSEVVLVRHVPGVATARAVVGADDHPFGDFPAARVFELDTDLLVDALWRALFGGPDRADPPATGAWRAIADAWFEARHAVHPRLGDRIASSLLSHVARHDLALPRARAVLERVRDKGDAAGEADAALSLSAVLLGCGQAREAEKVLDRMPRLRGAAHTPERRLRLERQRAELARLAGDARRAATLLDSALDLCAGLADVGPVIHELALLRRRLGQWQLAGDGFDDAVDTFRQVGDLCSAARALGDKGNLHADCNEPELARSCFEEGLRMCREIGDRHGAGVRLNNLGTWHVGRGDFAAARPLLEESLRIAREEGRGPALASRTGNLGMWHFQQGQMFEAYELFEEALAIAREVGDGDQRLRWQTNLGIVQAQRGHLREALAHLEPAARELEAAIGSNHPRVQWLTGIVAQVRSQLISSFSGPFD